MQLDFALSKAYADLKEHRRSFAHLLKGTAAKRSMIAYDEAAALSLFDRLEQTFTPQLMRAKSGGDPSRAPIFVLGMPRSGTTLVEQILASHPKVHGAGELKTMNDVVLTVRGPDGNTMPYPELMPSLPYPRPEQFTDTLAILGATNERLGKLNIATLLDTSFIKSAEDRGLGK